MSAVKRSGSQRQLSGFGGLLDWRPLDFTESVPYVFCCTLCGVVAAFPKRLTPCCHVFCPACFDRIAVGQRVCPLDQTSFTDSMIESLDSVHSGVNWLRVRCPNATHGCTFVTALGELKDHFSNQCDHHSVVCRRCGLTILQRNALSHYSLDCSGVRKVLSASEDGSSYRDVSCSLGRIRKSRSANSLLGSPGPTGRYADARKSTSADTAAHKAQTGTAVRILAQEKPETSVPSVSSSNSGESSVDSPLIKNQDYGALTKQDRQHDTNTTSPPKRAEGAAKKYDTLSEIQLLDIVESMIARASQKASDAAVIVEVDVQPPTRTREGMSTSVAEAQNKTSGTEVPTLSSAEPLSHSCGVTLHDNVEKQDSEEGVIAAASLAGFAFCYITGLVGSESRLACGEELFLRSDSSKLAECAFRVHARLRRDSDGNVLICFTLCICGGTWRQVTELALSKRINLVLVHPWNQAQNEQLRLCLKRDAMPRRKTRNPLGRWDFWTPTTEMKLRELAARGFVSSGALCVALQMDFRDAAHACSPLWTLLSLYVQVNSEFVNSGSKIKGKNPHTKMDKSEVIGLQAAHAKP
ncbi:E3 ubiquitin-protein ligase PDZRN3-like [Dermacentor albipictus]|uniref:E3 ubiquitin-protein ligase PDZRN3-like n=1 Tax=Dermacentor albipictus TaxID=60249 RepID=UPI0038FC1D0A